MFVTSTTNTTHQPTHPTHQPTHPTEYATFWSRVQVACQRYLAGVHEGTVETMYTYLQDSTATTTATATPESAAGDAAETCTLGDTSTGSHSLLSLLEFDMDGEEEEEDDDVGRDGEAPVADASSAPSKAMPALLSAATVAAGAGGGRV